jgi:hypothetical protein
MTLSSDPVLHTTNKQHKCVVVIWLCAGEGDDEDQLVMG